MKSPLHRLGVTLSQNRLYRRVAAAIGFLLFGALFLTCMLLIICAARLPRPYSRTIGRKIVQSGVLVFRWYLAATSLVTVRFIGFRTPQAQPPGIYVSNHPGLLDAFFLLSRCPHLTCLVKEKVFRHPLLRPAMSILGFVISVPGESVVDSLVTRTASGESLLVFPEGGRSPAHNRPASFERGAATVAVRSELPVFPVIARYSRPFLGKGESWWGVISGHVEIVFELCYPILPKKQTHNSGREEALLLSQELEELYRSAVSSRRPEATSVEICEKGH